MSIKLSDLQNIDWQRIGTWPMSVKATAIVLISALVLGGGFYTFSQDQIAKYSQTNSCYLPLLKDSAYYQKGSRVGYDWTELFNDSIDSTSPYTNRYLVGDFMVLDENLESRGIVEKNPDLSSLIDFKKYDAQLLELMNDAEQSTEDLDILHSYIRDKYAKDSTELVNFYEKVWRYKTPPFARKFSRLGSNVYASGQRVCLCEAREDTLLMIAQFATSSKRLEPLVRTDENGQVLWVKYVQGLPINRRRAYYANEYRITSKNWESSRRYEQVDILHDKKLGGGNSQVTRYQDKSELPNFLLMKPTNDYPKAMTQNGIHEVALSELSRGMLGTANSIGCIRLSDFGSKFSRWWVPQNARFFVLYKDDRYHKKLSLESVKDEMPFKNETEGNLFRKWLHEYKPLRAKQMHIDLEGSYDNGFILDAYNLYGQEYEKSREEQR